MQSYKSWLKCDCKWSNIGSKKETLKIYERNQGFSCANGQRWISRYKRGLRLANGETLVREIIKFEELKRVHQAVACCLS